MTMADGRTKPCGDAEEIRDTLIAISVIAKRLASKLETRNRKTKEEKNEREEQE